jgi:hypothetical protein
LSATARWLLTQTKGFYLFSLSVVIRDKLGIALRLQLEQLARFEIEKTRYAGILRLTIGDRVKFVDNIAPALGLVNNARGRVVGFGKRTDSDEIDIVFVKLIDNSRLSGLAGLEQFGTNVIPVPRCTTDFPYRTGNVRRSQFPLAVAYAATIHSVQSLTWRGPIVTCLNTAKFNAKARYVALSRPTDLSQLVFLTSSLIKHLRRTVSQADRYFENHFLTPRSTRTTAAYVEPVDMDTFFLDSNGEPERMDESVASVSDTSFHDEPEDILDRDDEPEDMVTSDNFISDSFFLDSDGEPETMVESDEADMSDTLFLDEPEDILDDDDEPADMVPSDGFISDSFFLESDEEPEDMDVSDASFSNDDNDDALEDDM